MMSCSMSTAKVGTDVFHSRQIFFFVFGVGWGGGSLSCLVTLVGVTVRLGSVSRVIGVIRNFAHVIDEKRL